MPTKPGEKLFFPTVELGQPTKPGEKLFFPTVELGQLLSIGIYVIVLCRERKKSRPCSI